VTGYEVAHVSETWASIVGEGDRDICIAFQRVPEAKLSKNRVHVDLAALDEEAEAQRIEGLGAVRRWTSDKPDDPFVVFADPEGNEFCIVRQQP
jgi:predicted enzyme related to lactoylglutathione lyase